MRLFVVGHCYGFVFAVVLILKFIDGDRPFGRHST
jgi:hypothetical protein